MNSTAVISFDHVVVDLCDAALIHMNAAAFVARNQVAMNNGVRGARKMNTIYPAMYPKAAYRNAPTPDVDNVCRSKNP